MKLFRINKGRIAQYGKGFLLTDEEIRALARVESLRLVGYGDVILVFKGFNLIAKAGAFHKKKKVKKHLTALHEILG